MWARVVRKGFKEVEFNFFDLLARIVKMGRKEKGVTEKKKEIRKYIFLSSLVAFTYPRDYNHLLL